MSQFGLNSFPIVDNNAMGGFRAGLDTMRGIRHSNSNLATEELGREINQQKLEEDRLDTPVKAAKRALEYAQAESDLADINKGGRDQDRQMMRDQKAAELAAKLNENQLNDLKKRISGVQAVGQIFGPEANPATMAMSWETAREEGKQYGFDIGEYSEQAATRVLRMQAQTPMAMDIAKHAATKGIDNQFDLINKGAAHSYDMAKQIQNQGFLAGESKLSRETQERIARTYAAGKGGGGTGDPKNWGQLETQTFIKANKYLQTGDEKLKPSDAEIQLLENKMARAEAMALIKEDPMFSIHFMNSEQSGTPLPPDVVAKISAALPRYMAMTNSGKMVAALRAKAGGGGRSVTPPASGTKPASSGGFTLRGSRPAGG
jgi:hypothetical protein